MLAPYKDRTCDVWLWIQHFDAHADRLQDHVGTFPALPKLQLTCFADPDSTAVIVRLQFEGSGGDRMALRVWATMAGLEYRETNSWPRERRTQLVRTIGSYRCSVTEISPLTHFARQLAATARDALRKKRSAKTSSRLFPRARHTDFARRASRLSTSQP